MSRRRIVTPSQARFIRKAFKVRVRLTNKALAAKYDIAVNTVRAYGYGDRQ
jgi:hypothetical protein